MPSPLLTRYAPMSVRSWLVALIAVAMVPAFAFSFLLINRNNRAQEQALSSLAVLAARSRAESIDRQIKGMVTTMRVLAVSPSLRHNDWPGFHGAVAAGLDLSSSFVVVAADDRRQILNTAVDYGSPLGPLQETDLYREVLQTKEIKVSGALWIERSKQWVYVVAMPLDPPAGEARLMLSGQRIDALADDFTRVGVEGGWEAALVDRDGVVLASTAPDVSRGQPFFLPMAASEFGQVERLKADGREVDVVSQRSELTGWSVKIWADAAQIRAPLSRTYRMLMLGALAMMLAATAAAYFLGRQIAASVRHLATDAGRMGRGEDVRDRASPVNELTAVSHALAEASARRRASENEIRFLLREVAHRSKNQLTVISSLATQSAEGAKSVADFTENFQQRIHGLSRSTDLLLAGSSSGVDLGELVRSQTEPFKPEHDAALEIEGPPFRLGAQAAQMMGLVFHELATNAAKHGAFSAPNGQVRVTWSIADERLALKWRETAAKPIKKATTRGFGTRLLIRTINGALRGETKSTYHRDGIEVDACMPLEGLRSDADK